MSAPFSHSDTNDAKQTLLQGLVAALRGLLFLIVGFLAAVLHALLWGIRIGAPVLYVWLALKAWPVLTDLYGAVHPTLRYSLLAVIVVVTLLPVVYTGAKRAEWLWGAFYASAALLWMAWRLLPQIWPHYSMLFLLSVPGAYTIVTMVLVARYRMRRALRQVQTETEKKEAPHV